MKVAVVDGTGKVVATDTIYPHQPANRWDAVAGHPANGWSRRTGSNWSPSATAPRPGKPTGWRADLIARCPGLIKVVVSEAGASVYSASAYASGELPDLDVSIRGAVSIARRLQDPLAELVKIDPKSIGVGQYQHDVAESVLARSRRRGGRGLRERRRRRGEHRVRAAAVPGVRDLRDARREHRQASGHQRPVRLSPGAQERGAARAEGLRAVRRVPADRATATIRWTPPACTRRRTRWCARS